MVKKITIDTLAVMIKRGFDDVDKRFDDVDKRFDGIDGRLMKLESDTDYLKARVTEIGRTLEEHGELLDEHSEELRWLHKKIDEIIGSGSKKAITYKEFSALVSRVSSLERKIAASIR